MPNNNYKLNFTGYWLDSNTTQIPTDPGIFCVYACIYFHGRKTVGISELLYIGESNEVGTCITNHDQREAWLSYVTQNRPGEVLCYSFAPMIEPETEMDRKRVESALVAVHKPCLNNEMPPLPDCVIDVKTNGRNSLLQNFFTAHPYREPVTQYAS